MADSPISGLPNGGAVRTTDDVPAVRAGGNVRIQFGTAASQNASAFAPASHTHVAADITDLQALLDEKAPLVSPALTGNPTAPTPPPGDNDTSIATTAFVQAAVTVAAGRESFGTIRVDSAGDVVANGPSAAVTLRGAPGIALTADLALDEITIAPDGLAPLDSPGFFGVPTAPTVGDASDSSPTLATTSFVQAAIRRAAAGDSVNVFQVFDPPSPYQPTNVPGNSMYQITGLTGDLQIDPPQGTFTGDVFQTVLFEITASGGDRAVSFGSGISLRLGVPKVLTVRDGETRRYALYSTDGGATWFFDGDEDISALPTKTVPASGDWLIGADGNGGNRRVKFSAINLGSGGGGGGSAVAAPDIAGYQTAVAGAPFVDIEFESDVTGIPAIGPGAWIVLGADPWWVAQVVQLLSPTVAQARPWNPEHFVLPGGLLDRPSFALPASNSSDVFAAAIARSVTSDQINTEVLHAYLGLSVDVSGVEVLRADGLVGLSAPIGIAVPDSPNPNQAPNRAWIERAIAESTLLQGTYKPATNDPPLDLGTPLNGETYIIATVDSRVPEQIPAGVSIPGLDGVDLWNNDRIIWSEAALRWDRVAAPVGTLWQDFYYTATNTPDLAFAPKLDGWTWGIVTPDPLQGVVLNPLLPGVGGSIAFMGDYLLWSEGAGVFELVPGAPLTTDSADARYVNATGDVMSGNLDMDGHHIRNLPDPQVDGDAVNYLTFATVTGGHDGRLSSLENSAADFAASQATQDTNIALNANGIQSLQNQIDALGDLAQGYDASDVPLATPIAGLPGNPADVQAALEAIEYQLQSLTSALVFAGTYDAAADQVTWVNSTGLTNGPLPDPTPIPDGWFIYISVAGDGAGSPWVPPGQVMGVGDQLIVAGDEWRYHGASAAGGVASGIAFQPAGGVGATNVQAAIEELDAEKVAIAGQEDLGDMVWTQGRSARFIHAEMADTGDGKIGARLYNAGLNIVGVRTEAAAAAGVAGREISAWGYITQRQNTDQIRLGRDPTAALEAATKQYSDNNLYAGQTFNTAVDLNTVVPPTYRPGIYGLSNGVGITNRPTADGGFIGNAYLMLTTHNRGSSVDCMQHYWNAEGQMYARAKHDGAASFTAWVRIDSLASVPRTGNVNMTGWLNFRDSQAVYFDCVNNAAADYIVLHARRSDAKSNWAIYNRQSGGVVGGQSEGRFALYAAVGGWGWREVFTTTINSPPQVTFLGAVNAPGFNNTSAAVLKRGIREVQRDEVEGAFAALRPKRFRWRPRTHDDAGKPMLLKDPDRGEQWGFVADEMATKPELKNIVARDEKNAPTGYDVTQVVALLVAKVQALSEEVKKLKESKS